jgi:hypothetical protein
VNFRIVKLSSFSGSRATIYSVILEKDEATKVTLYERFNQENSKDFGSEIKNIAMTLRSIGHRAGANDNFFKDWEGKPGDGVCALYDDPDKNLRLYCIRFGRTVLIVGGGGPKPKHLHALQESEKLTLENNYMKVISAKIGARIRERELTWTEDELELEGEFKFYDHE